MSGKVSLSFTFCLTTKNGNSNEKTFFSSIFFLSHRKRLKFQANRGEPSTKEKEKQQKQLTMDNANSLTSGTVLLRSVSIFLSNRRQSKQLKDQAQKAEKKKRTKTLSKLDEQMGKLQPKMLESLKRKTHFNK